MPFLYELKLAAGEPPFTFVQQLVPAGSLAGTGQALATVTDGTMEYHITAPLQGLLAAWNVEHGDIIEPGDTLARLVAEGDEKPVADAVAVRLG